MPNLNNSFSKQLGNQGFVETTKLKLIKGAQKIFLIHMIPKARRSRAGAPNM
jgi:hypothetical protein